MGSTPMKTSLVGKAVIDRMLADESNDDTSLYREGSKIFMKTKYSEADLSLTDDATHLDMGHIYPAVKFWNEIGRYTGAQSSCVRSFMLDPNNYRIQYGRRNCQTAPHETYKSVADKINRNFLYICFSAPENFENIDKMIENLEREGLR